MNNSFVISQYRFNRITQTSNPMTSPETNFKFKIPFKLISPHARCKIAKKKKNHFSVSVPQPFPATHSCTAALVTLVKPQRPWPDPFCPKPSIYLSFCPSRTSIFSHQGGSRTPFCADTAQPLVFFRSTLFPPKGAVSSSVVSQFDNKLLPPDDRPHLPSGPPAIVAPKCFWWFCHFTLIFAGVWDSCPLFLFFQQSFFTLCCHSWVLFCFCRMLLGRGL